MEPYGDLLWVDTNASSCSEMIYEFYLKGKELGLKMNNDAARLLFAGIVGDTGDSCFQARRKKRFPMQGN